MRLILPAYSILLLVFCFHQATSTFGDGDHPLDISPLSQVGNKLEIEPSNDGIHDSVKQGDGNDGGVKGDEQNPRKEVKVANEPSGGGQRTASKIAQDSESSATKQLSPPSNPEANENVNHKEEIKNYRKLGEISDDAALKNDIGKVRKWKFVEKDGKNEYVKQEGVGNGGATGHHDHDAGAQVGKGLVLNHNHVNGHGDANEPSGGGQPKSLHATQQKMLDTKKVQLKSVKVTNGERKILKADGTYVWADRAQAGVGVVHNHNHGDSDLSAANPSTVRAKHPIAGQSVSGPGRSFVGTGGTKK